MISYNYTNTVFDPNAKDKLMDYKTVMSIPEDLLIKPEDLKEHIGEILMFHSGRGQVYSAILTDAKLEKMNPYTCQMDLHFMYTHGLDMSYFYSRDEYSKFFTVESAYIISVCNIIDDDFTYPLYVSIPTKEELEFRNYWLSQDDDYLIEEHDRLKKLFNR